MEDVLNYIKLCREALLEVISTYDMRDFEAEKKTEKRQDIQEEIQNRKINYVLLNNKNKRFIHKASEMSDLTKTYDSCKRIYCRRFSGLEMQEKN